MQDYQFDAQNNPPRCLYIATNTSDVCNYKCKVCHIWMMPEDKSKENKKIDLRTKDNLLHQFHELNPEGIVSVGGGEPFLDMEEMLTLARTCKKLGLYNSTVTNSSLIKNREIAGQIVEAGFNHISISLDSIRPEIHEYVRGVKGCFDKTIEAVKLLLDAGKRINPEFKVYLFMILFNENIDEMEDYIKYCKELGVHGVHFQPLSHTFANMNKTKDVFFEKHFWHTEETKIDANEKIEKILKKYNDDPFVHAAQDDFLWISQYIMDPNFKTEEPFCGSHEKNIMVNTEGDISLCFTSSAFAPDLEFIGNVKDTSLLDIWCGEKAEKLRKKMNVCRLGCGIVSCHRRLDDEKKYYTKKVKE